MALDETKFQEALKQCAAPDTVHIQAGLDSLKNQLHNDCANQEEFKKAWGMMQEFNDKHKGSVSLGLDGDYKNFKGGNFDVSMNYTANWLATALGTGSYEYKSKGTE
jgi:acetoin utilization deacetylase AcuC-like enzyme